MSKTKVPCCLVTAMDRHTTDALLERLGLRQHFTCTVTGARAAAAEGGGACSRRGAGTQLRGARPPATVLCTSSAVSCCVCCAAPRCAPPRPAADDDMETKAQRFLSAAIKLGRPPNHCVVFAACPTAVTGAQRPRGCRRWAPAAGAAALGVHSAAPPHAATGPLALPSCAHSVFQTLPRPSIAHPRAAAHNCTMKAVAVMGTHEAFRLKNADLTCASLEELTVYNIRWAGRAGTGQGARGEQAGPGLGLLDVRRARLQPEPAAHAAHCHAVLPCTPQAPVCQPRQRAHGLAQQVCGAAAAQAAHHVCHVGRRGLRKEDPNPPAGAVPPPPRRAALARLGGAP